MALAAASLSFSRSQSSYEMLPSHSKKERRTAAPGAPRDTAKVTRTPEALRRDKIGVMDEQMLRRVMARAHRGDVGAQALLRELVEADEPKRKLPVIRFDGLLEIVDPPDEQGEGGVREPRRPLPKGPSDSSAL